jgi:hypothetical protein
MSEEGAQVAVRLPVAVGSTLRRVGDNRLRGLRIPNKMPRLSP